MKKAILYGCNYSGKSKLGGCINDVNCLEEFLSGRGYVVKRYTDDTIEDKPTKNLIMRTLKETVLSLVKGDTLFIGFSGHGSQISDTSKDEIDGLDECIVPCDYQKTGMITDDQLGDIIKSATEDTKIFGLFDCCHSGTGLDLPYLIECDRIHSKFVKNQKLKILNFGKETEIYLLSGCTDPETSADVKYKGKRGGALVISFLEVFGKCETHLDLLLNVRKYISDEKMSNQVPQLTSNQKTDCKIFI